MGDNSAGEDDENHHAVQMWEVNKERLDLMQQKISATPRILSKTSGSSSCCIFRVPQSLVEINGKSYQPHVVSIGPYHHGARNLEMIEEQKWRFLGSLLKRTESKGLKLEDYLKAVQEVETEARVCYSENIHVGTHEFVEILVVDGCFIIELFRKFAGVVPFEQDDPILSMGWVYSFLLRDLIRLENQIPFFILQRLFQLSNLPGEESGPSLANLVLKFFNNAMERSDELISELSNLEGKHILDFLRSSFIRPGYEEHQDGPSVPSHVIQNITKLRRSGISLKLNKNKSDSFLVVKFRHGVIEMSPITLDDFSSAFLLNCVAYEQCHRGYSKHMTTYATLLDNLINTGKDVDYLCECNIIENYYGTEGEISKFINNLGKEVTVDLDSCYLAELFVQVNKYYRSAWHVQWASFKYTYFNSTWSFISAVAAFVLLVLTILQTLYTVLGYVRPPP